MFYFNSKLKTAYSKLQIENTNRIKYIAVSKMPVLQITFVNYYYFIITFTIM